MSMNAIAARVNNIEGWMTDEEIKALYDAAREQAAKSMGGRCAVAVEIGSYRGLSTVTIALAVQEFGGIVWAVDPHEGEKYGFSAADADYLVANLEAFGVRDVVTPITRRSADVAREWTNGEIDLLWIDGDHEYEAVKADIEAWTPFVRAGGYVVMHDCGSSNWPGVQRAYSELLGNPDFEQVYGVDSLRLVKRVHKAQVPSVPMAEEKPKAKKARK